MSASFLLIDDDASQLRLLGRWIEREGWNHRGASSGEEGLACLRQGLPDVVVLDLYLDGENGLDVLDRLFERHPSMPVIMLTAETKIDTVVDAMQRGASDYLTKPMSRTKVITTLRETLAKASTVHQQLEVDREEAGVGFGDLVGRSAPMKELFRQLDRVGPSEVTVLIQGESGTGKELVAAAIHGASARRTGPFVAINCAAIPEALQESELFGHEKGAFTGASERRPGRFEQADGGTLFLDEVGELSAALQAKLLRALQERRFYRVGGNEEISVDVRILAATHRHLEEAVEGGHFREDLFYRLAVYELLLPPLRDRGEDVVELAQVLLNRKPGGAGLTLAPETLDLLRAHPWPGNVRELDNAMARACVAADGVVRPADLPRRVRSGKPALANVKPNVSVPDDDGLPPLQALEKRAIETAIANSGGNLSEAMRTLGMARTTFYRRLKRYGLDG